MVFIASRPITAPKSHNMGTPEYTKLKDLITLEVGMSESHSQIIQAMKALYQKDINSIRRFEQIKTIGQLLKVLETRDVLSEENILPLKVLAQQLPNDQLMKNIIDYEKSYVLKAHINQYEEQPEEVLIAKQVSSSSPPPPNSDKYSLFKDGISDRKRERIIKKVTEEIGSYWRNLARYLGIREYKIDEIQSENTKVEEKAAKVLEIYESNTDHQKWFFNLLDALEKAHRRDLSKQLKEIATMNI